MTMIMPHIHTNGTSRPRLIGQQLNALHGLREARRWLEDGEPNRRDYLSSDDFRAAQDLYLSRLQIIDKMILEIEQYVEALDVDGFTK